MVARMRACILHMRACILHMHACILHIFFYAGRSSFPRCVSVALRMGWMVEVYGWRASMSSCYPAMAALSRGRMVIQYLDEWRAEVTSATERVCVYVCGFSMILLLHYLTVNAMQVTKVLERRYVSDDQVRDRVLDSMRGASGRDMPLFGTGYVLQGKRISRWAECTNPMSCLVFFPVCTRTDAPFSLPTVVEMVEAVVKQASDGGIFGSAVKAAFRIMHGRELPTKFGGQNMRLGDIMQMSRRIVMTVVNTQPLYKYVARVCWGSLSGF